jgi:hypothetical protein
MLLMTGRTSVFSSKKHVKYVYKAKNTALGIRHADHVAPSIRKSWH